ncbi:CtpA1 [Desulforapulum autotrophicum HRM2]|uniref:CtpA1 n=1 Tax=Desulforapulum autotrophicum (strain ATCC 43914 / DSM 3382 / VKM B-1955 / HRM2) TaxID=177437 RepID=C0QJT5_DESAH|nr:S41 family peptidase [Desulforapulum autotrophicum]ACN13938.1 CtpA1 [Desulforapulum autotrophicum HRM2]
MRFVAIIILGLLLWPGAICPAHADSMAWTNNQAMLTFFEAVTKIKKHGLDSPGPGRIVTSALKAYMEQYDPYGDYLSPAEYREWKQAQSFRYYGVGMEILQRDSRFYCLPRPDSQAQTAGIEQGDELVAVDGQPVASRSIYRVAGSIRGEKDTRVKLTMNRNSVVFQVNIERGPLKDRSVWLSQTGRLDILRISHFTPQSLSEIKAVLGELDQTRQLVLDLRNNPGGDLFAAVDIAGLFLPPGKKIISIETNTGKVDYTAKGQIWTGERLGIWQNRFTASASEVLIIGLADNLAAKSFGSTSYGKALTQKVMELSDGSALVISRGRITGPRGIGWQNHGLTPMVRIQDSDNTWVQITQQALR